MPIQIFLLPVEYGHPNKSLTASFRKLENLTFYPVFYGQQYTVKSWLPVCKLNAILYKNKSDELELEGSISFANFVSTIGSKGIQFSNHYISRSVFEFESTYYFFLFQSQEARSISQVLQFLDTVSMKNHRFWTLTILPSDTEYLKSRISFNLWFVTLVKSAIKMGHLQVNLGRFDVQFRYEELKEIFISNPGNLIKCIKFNVQKSGRNFKYYSPETMAAALVRTIHSNLVSSPLDYINYINKGSKILSVYEMVFSFSVFDANMSFTYRKAYADNGEMSVTFCRETPFYSIMRIRNLNFPFSFIYDDNFFSFLTCSGKEDSGFSPKILFSPLLWLTWLCIFGCVGLIAALVTIVGDEKFDFSMMVDQGISLFVGTFGSEISIRNDMKMKKIKALVLLWTFVGILLGNLYQGVLTETLIFPKQHETNITLESMVRQNFTLILTPEMSLKTQAFEDALKKNVIDSLFYKYSQAIMTKFFRRLIRSFVFRLMSGSAYQNLVVNVCDKKLANCKNWTQVFAAKPYIPRISELFKPSVNSRSLLTELSRCTANTAFIHDRTEMMKTFKPKLPKVVHSHRRELKFVHLPDDILNSIEVFVCEADLGNVVQPYIKKYVESGLHERWERFARILKFRWTSVKSSKYINIRVKEY